MSGCARQALPQEDEDANQSDGVPDHNSADNSSTTAWDAGGGSSPGVVVGLSPGIICHAATSALNNTARHQSRVDRCILKGGMGFTYLHDSELSLTGSRHGRSIILK